MNLDLVRKYFTVVDNPDEADFAIVFMTSPNSVRGMINPIVRKEETVICLSVTV